MIVEVKKMLSQNFGKKDIEEANFVLGIEIHRDRSSKAIEMDLGLQINLFTHKKRTRTRKIKVCENADPTQSNPLGLQFMRIGPNCSWIGSPFFFLFYTM